VTTRSPIHISRRRLLAASGVTLAAGAPAFLAACGAEDEDADASPEREAELLNAVLAQQLGVAEALAAGVGGNTPPELEQPFARLVDLRDESAQELERAIGELGGTPVDQGTELVGAESPTEGVARQLEASIAASLEAIAELSPEQRQPVHIAITEDAAALAEIRLALGEEPAPDAFVMGPVQEAA
jgi:hypothetical protein